MKHLTFDQIPIAISELFQKLNNIEKLLIEQSKQKVNESNEELLTVQQTAIFLNLSVATIYSKVSRGDLPVMKRAKHLYFSKDELMNYLKEGRKKTNQEIELEAEKFLSNTKKGLNNEW